MKVGTRELKNRLSYYLRRVRGGEAIFVTDRGSVIAEVRAACTPKGRRRQGDEEALAELAAGGGFRRAPGR